MLNQLKQQIIIRKEIKAIKKQLKKVNNFTNKTELNTLLNKVENETIDFQGKYIRTNLYSEKLNSIILDIVYNVSILRNRYLTNTFKF